MKHWKVWADLLSISAIGVFLTVEFGFPALGRLEGYLFPVVSEAELFDPRLDPPPSYRTIWRATATKLRDCADFRGIKFYIGQRGSVRSQAVRSGFADKPQLRNKGELEWDGLWVYLIPEDVLENSYADVYHQCPNRPWLTVSRYYTSPQPTLETENGTR